MENIKQYLQKLIAKWDKYEVYGGAEALSFQNDIEMLLEHWNERIEPLESIPEGLTDEIKTIDNGVDTKEWREELEKTMLTYLKNSDKIGIREITNDLTRLIEQLLSERSFSKEELELIKMLMVVFKVVDGGEVKVYKSIVKKVNRLLSLENQKELQEEAVECLS